MGSFYFPGDSWLHRTAAGIKLAILMFAGAGLMWVHDWRALVIVLVIVLLMLQQSGVRMQTLWLHLKTLSWLVVVLCANTFGRAGGRVTYWRLITWGSFSFYDDFDRTDDGGFNLAFAAFA
jgi:energy-coupling factor transporter transmembrane protein EcfT